MEPETSTPNNHKTLALLGALVLITVAGAIIPASWFNVDNKNQPLDLTSVNAVNVTPKDKNTNQPLTWKQLAESALSDQPEVLTQLQSAPIDTETISQLNDEENLTASFSKNLYVASAYLKENNITDEDSKQNVINQLIEQEAAKIVPTVYSYKDINVAQTESKTSIKTYGNTVASLFSATLTEKSLADDISALKDFLKTKSGDSITPIKRDHDRVSAMLQKLLKVSVPPSAVVYHLSAINKISEYNDTLSNVSKMETDPLRANLALKKYTDVVFSTTGVYQNLSDYFNIKNIVFSSKESGYMFTVGYTPK